MSKALLCLDSTRISDDQFALDIEILKNTVNTASKSD
jgi:hypothetical protein